jgi:hypothetical protein
MKVAFRRQLNGSHGDVHLVFFTYNTPLSSERSSKNAHVAKRGMRRNNGKTARHREGDMLAPGHVLTQMKLDK